MCELLVEGGERLYGELTIQGSKNSVLPILAATLLCADTCVIENCPKLRDVEASVAILRHLGCCTHWEGGALVVDTARMDRCTVPDALMREMRSSVIFLGAILARCTEAVSYTHLVYRRGNARLRAVAHERIACIAAGTDDEIGTEIFQNGVRLTLGVGEIFERDKVCLLYTSSCAAR